MTSGDNNITSLEIYAKVLDWFRAAASVSKFNISDMYHLLKLLVTTKSCAFNSILPIMKMLKR